MAKSLNSDHQRLPRFRTLRVYAFLCALLWRYGTLFLLSKLLPKIHLQSLYSNAHKKTAKGIKLLLLSLKGIYIKIGQTLSIMGYVLPRELIDGLESLQDQVPPHPFEEINQHFLKDFGKPAHELYAHFETTPMASASLGQVHVATHHNGDKLAVKLQYPGIESTTQKDLKTLKAAFSWLHAFFPQFNLKTVYHECATVLRQELNYLNEAQNIQRLSENFSGDEMIVFPKVYPELTSSKVLTLSFIEGTKITDITADTQTPVSKADLATELTHFYCKQVFTDGLFHADPHPGNIVVTKRGQLGVLDFGAIATVSQPMREGLTLFVEGLIKRDSRILSDAIHLMGFVSKDNQDETIEKVVDYFYSKIRGLKIDNLRNLQLSQFDTLGELIELKRMDISFYELSTLFVIPKEWILLERTIILATGITTQLDATFNPFDTVIPYVEKFILGDDEKRLTDILFSASKTVLMSYLTLPDDFRKFVKKSQTQGMYINALKLQKELAGVRKAVSLLATALLAASSGFLSWVMAQQHQYEVATRFEWGAYGFAAIFLGLLLKR